MAHYFDPHGRALRLGSELGAGGEGAVFEIVGDDHRVAKIYHRPISAEKAEKLRAMAAIASNDLTAFASWPLAVLEEGKHRRVEGIVLPRITAHNEIHTLYSPAQRKLEYPDKDWSFLVHTAMNCAAAFDAIHRKSHVIGDVNQGNLLVSQRGTVFLIDCDSFQVNIPGRLFLCDVGVPQYTPPELQGQSFRGLERTANHDCFGLALIIFHLLFMGRHPFAGRFWGQGDMPIERAIAEYRYAFGREASARHMAPPPQTLSIGEIAPPLVPLFERAFGRGSELPAARPTADGWHQALAALLPPLQNCTADRGHRFTASISACPWCRLMLDGAPNFFFSVTCRNATPDMLNVTADIAALCRAIESVPSPRAVPLAPSPEAELHVRPVPPPPAIESAQTLATMVKYVALGSLAANAGMLVVPEVGYISVPVFGVFALWWIVLFLASGHRPERQRRRRVWRARRTQLKQLQAGWQGTRSLAEAQFRKAQKELTAARDQIAKLKAAHDAELRKLTRHVRERQLRAFLQGKLIWDHQIDGIGSGRQATLMSYGVETACDVEYNRVLGIPGMGPAVTNNLCAWRSALERQFTPDKAQGVPQAERQGLLLKYAQVRQQLELRLRQGPDRLRAINATMQQTFDHLTDQIDAAHLALAQARADLQIMSTALPNE